MMQLTQSSGPRNVGIYGWKKRCLYLLILVLLVVVFCTLVATLLLVNLIHFNLGGLGALSVYAGGVYLRDVSDVLDSLVASHISSRRGQPLPFESSYNMSLVLRSDSGSPTQILHFWSTTQEPNHQEVVATASQFRVSDPRGRPLFTADTEHVYVGADVLKVLEGGVHFSGSVQTSMVRSNLGSGLMLESATRQLYVKAPAGVSIESRASDISISCLSNLKLTSTDGQVKLKAPGIYIPHIHSVSLQRPQPVPLRSFGMERGPMPRGYQVCMCTNGKLFAAHPDSECGVDGENTQCR